MAHSQAQSGRMIFCWSQAVLDGNLIISSEKKSKVNGMNQGQNGIAFFNRATADGRRGGAFYVNNHIQIWLRLRLIHFIVV